MFVANKTGGPVLGCWQTIAVQQRAMRRKEAGSRGVRIQVHRLNLEQPINWLLVIISSDYQQHRRQRHRSQAGEQEQQRRRDGSVLS